MLQNMGQTVPRIYPPNSTSHRLTSTTRLLWKHVTLRKSLLKSASNCLWTPASDGPASVGSLCWAAGRAAARPLQAPKGRFSSVPRTVFLALDNPTQGKIKAGCGSSTENGKERLRQTLLSGDFSKRQSSCPLCCPLVKCRQYLYSWSSTWIHGFG